MIFKTTKEEDKKIKEWKDQQLLKDPIKYALGERWGYKFIPTGLGMLIDVMDGATGDKLEVRGTENW